MNRKMDSFDHRIDDDLFESIISYLPIKDKLRYESVSKRFQRFIFNKQNTLGLSWNDHSLNSLDELDLLKNDKINVSKLERLLKKFRFITAIEFDITYSNQTEVLNTIIQNCKHLTSIDFDFYSLVYFEAMKEFIQKFRQQLRQISFFKFDISSEEEIFEYLLKFSPNLLSMEDLIIDDIDIDEFEFERFTKFKLNFRSINEKTSKKPAQYLKNFQYLSITSCSNYSNKLFKEITKFKYLKVLKIEFKISNSGYEVLCQYIQNIAKNCDGLQYFQINLNPILAYFDPMICFQSISHFHGIKTLRFL